MQQRPFTLASGIALIVLGAGPSWAGCLPHPHAGFGVAATKASAEKRAILNWCGAVRRHDGDRWTYYGLDGSAPTCRRTGSLWSCAARAQPCRPSSGGTRNFCVI